MPFGPADVAKHNPLIKTDRHMNMWLDMVNTAVKRGRPEQKAIDEANSVINMDMARSRVGLQGQPLRDADPGFQPQRSAPGESSARPELPFNAELSGPPPSQDPESTIPAGRNTPQQAPYFMTPPSPVPTPAEVLHERFPGETPPPDATTALKRYDAENPPKPKGKPIRPGTQERFLDPTKVTL